MAMSVTYTTFNGQIVYENRGGVESYYAPDTLGSTAALLNASGVVTDTFTYQPYGEIASHVGSSVTPFTYCGTLGYYTDSANSSIYVRARYYRPNLARWQTVDPLWPGESAYVYVSGNPTIFVDPNGTQRSHLRPKQKFPPSPVSRRPLPVPPPNQSPSDPWWLVPLHCLGKVASVVGLTLTPTATSSSDARGPAPDGSRPCPSGNDGTWTTAYEPNQAWENFKRDHLKGCRPTGPQSGTNDVVNCPAGGYHYRQTWKCASQVLSCSTLCCICSTADGSYAYSCKSDCHT